MKHIKTSLLNLENNSGIYFPTYNAIDRIKPRERHNFCIRPRNYCLDIEFLSFLMNFSCFYYSKFVSKYVYARIKGRNRVRGETGRIPPPPSWCTAHFLNKKQWSSRSDMFRSSRFIIYAYNWSLIPSYWLYILFSFQPPSNSLPPGNYAYYY